MMPFDSKAVGVTIRKLRKKKNLTQETLSGLAGIAATHLSMIETGDKQPNFETIWKIAEAFDIRPNQLVLMIEEEMEKADK